MKLEVKSCTAATGPCSEWPRLVASTTKLHWCTAKRVVRAKDASSLSPSNMHHNHHLCLWHGAPEICTLRTMGQQLLILLPSLRWEWNKNISSVLLSGWCVQSLCVNHLGKTWPSYTTSPSCLRKRHAHGRISQYQQEQVVHLKASRILTVQAGQREFKAVLGVTSNCMCNLLHVHCNYWLAGWFSGSFHPESYIKCVQIKKDGCTTIANDLVHSHNMGLIRNGTTKVSDIKRRTHSFLRGNH